MNEPVDSLIPALREQDEQAVEALVDAYWERAYRVALQITGDPGSAEDVAQETFVQVLRSVQTFDSTKRFRPWFFRILKNVALNHRRAEGRRKVRLRAQGRSRSSGLEQVDAVDAVRTYLARLEPAIRESLTLHFLGGLTHKEVAGVLACPQGTVSDRIRRGLETLRAKALAGVTMGGLTVAELLSGALESSAPSAPAAIELVASAARCAPLGAAPPAPSGAELLAEAADPAALSRLAAPLVALGALALATLVVALGGGDAPPPKVATAPDAPPTAPADPPREAIAGADGEGGDVPAAGNVETPQASVPPPATAAVKVKFRVLYAIPVAGARVRLKPDNGEAIEVVTGEGGVAVVDLALPTRVSATLLGSTFTLGKRPRPLPTHLQWVIGGHAQAPGSAPTLALDEPVGELALRLGDVVLRGRTVDATTRQGVAATVTDMSETLHTGADGRFAFVWPGSHRLLAVPFGATGYAATYATLDFKAPLNDLAIPLDRAFTFRGRVLDAAGEPVAGATVALGWREFSRRPQGPRVRNFSSIGNYGLGGGRFLEGGDPVPEGIDGDKIRGEGIQTTDADGGFSFQVTTRGGTTNIAITKDGYVRWARGNWWGVSAKDRFLVRPSDPPLEVRLQTALALEVEVVDEAGVAIAGANVAPLDPAAIRLHLPSGRAEVVDLRLKDPRCRTSSALGRATLDNLSGDPFDLLVAATGKGTRVLRVTAGDLRVVLPAARALRGRVASSHGVSLGHAMVIAYPAGSLDDLSRDQLVALVDSAGVAPSPAGALSAGATDAYGAFEVRALGEAVVDLLIARARGREFAVQALSRIPTGTAAELVVPAWDSLCLVKAKFKLDATEEGGVVRGSLFLRTPDGESAWDESYRWTAEDGTSFVAVEAETARELRAFLSAGERPYVVRTITAKAGDVVDLGTVTLPRSSAGGRVRVTIHWPDEPVHDLRFRYRDPKTGTVESDGYFNSAMGAMESTSIQDLRPLWPGQTELVVSVQTVAMSERGAAPRELAPIPVVVRAGTRTEVVVDLR